MAAFFAALLLLVGAPAYAHPGDHTMHVGHHVPDVYAQVDVKTVVQGEVPVALTRTDGASFSATKIVAMVSVTTSSLLGVQNLPRSYCCGTSCFGMSCCGVCIVTQSSSLSHPPACSVHVSVADPAVLGFEPSSLLEPPNTRA